MVLAVAAAVGISMTSDDGSSDASVAAGAGDQTNASAQTDQSGQEGRGRPGMAGTAGTITGIDGSTLSVETVATDDEDATTVTVETSDETTITESVDGSVGDLAVGDNVTVIGESTDAGVTAERLVDNGDLELSGPGGGPGGGPPEGMTPPEGQELPEGQGPPTGGGRFGGASGTISEIADGIVIVTTADGESVSVTLTEDTTISVTNVLALADLSEGDTVTVTGEMSDSTVAATAIRRGELGAGGFGGGGFGGGGMPPGGPAGSDPTTSTTGV